MVMINQKPQKELNSLDVMVKREDESQAMQCSQPLEGAKMTSVLFLSGVKTEKLSFYYVLISPFIKLLQDTNAKPWRDTTTFNL